MLGHLIKYDLKFIYKQLIVFYIIVLFCAILARLTNFETSSFWLKFIHEFAQGAAFGFSFGALVNGSIRTWVRFRMNLYGDESYLTHTLPLPRATLWASKFLTSLLVVLFSVLIIIFAILIMFFPFGVDFIWQAFIALLIGIILQIIFILQSGFVGILIGHRANNRRTLLSILSGFGIYILGGLIIVGSCFIWSNFNHSVDMLLHGRSYENSVTVVDGEITSVTTNQANLVELLYGIDLLYLILIIATYFINRQLLARGVDVD